jgi:hypothetical protein
VVKSSDLQEVYNDLSDNLKIQVDSMRQNKESYLKIRDVILGDYMFRAKVMVDRRSGEKNVGSLSRILGHAGVSKTNAEILSLEIKTDGLSELKTKHAIEKIQLRSLHPRYSIKFNTPLTQVQHTLLLKKLGESRFDVENVGSPKDTKFGLSALVVFER